MATVGIDIEQFVTQPFGSGIQRVLQHLAKEWPRATTPANFVAPWRDEFILLTPAQASELIATAFTADSRESIGLAVHAKIRELSDEAITVRPGALLSLFSSWILPEVSYLPSVLDRFELFNRSMPTAMIGYDALPMTEASNYRFGPNLAAQVSRYFRLMSQADSVICISNAARDDILQRLRRDLRLATTVAHPGGDHLPVSEAVSLSRDSPVEFLRVGTMESRKRPLEILVAFRQARKAGADIRLTFIGGPSFSHESINRELVSANREDIGFQWISEASDELIRTAMLDADVFLSIGTEGYGIPVLEAIRSGMPVLFGGTQPAGEIMRDKGARNIGGDSQEHLNAMFQTYSDRRVVDDLRSEVQSSGVPTWKDFTLGVVNGAVV